jgi:hypothetical protein
MGFTATLISVAMLVMAAPPAAASNEPVPGAPAVSPGSTRVQLPTVAIGGLDDLTITAQTMYPHAEGTTVGAPHICVSGGRSEIRTELRGEAEVQILLEHRIYGCRMNFPGYRFDAMAWTAQATTTIPTELTTFRSELRDGSWVYLGYEEDLSAPSTVVDLVWNGVGEEQVTPWTVGPSVCYVIPPVCVRGGVRVSRDATVEGSIDVRALDADITLDPAEAGSMRWAIEA